MKYCVNTPVIGVLGPCNTAAIEVQNLLQLFHIPQVSPIIVLFLSLPWH